MVRVRLFLFISAALPLAAACTAARTPRISYGPDLQLQRIVKGQTTRQEVVSRWGRPRDVLRASDSMVLIYESTDAEYDGEILKRSIRRLSLVFDEREVVKDHRVDELYREDPVYTVPLASPDPDGRRSVDFGNDRR